MPSSALVPSVSAPSRSRTATGRRDLLIGMMIVAVAPTAFWTVIMTATAHAFDLSLPLWGLAVPSVLMLALLVCIWASVTVSARAGSHAA